MGLLLLLHDQQRPAGSVHDIVEQRTSRRHAIVTSRRRESASAQRSFAIRNPTSTTNLDDRAPLLSRFTSWLGAYEYAGDWNLSPEWWGTQGNGWGRTEGETVFSSASALSGAVTVTAHPASVLGDEREASWRVLRFNDATRQSVVRIADGRVDTTTLATEYLKTVVAVIGAVVFGEEAEGAEGAEEAEEFAAYPALCIGVGGGSIVMFLESYFPELDIDAVEVDPVVVAAASAMGVAPPDAIRKPIVVRDAATYVGSAASKGNYELVYIDAFDGDDCVPEALCGEDFARKVADDLSATGTLVMNLHEDDGNWRETARVFADAVVGQRGEGKRGEGERGEGKRGERGVAFTCTCKRQGNVVLAASRRAVGLPEAELLRSRASYSYFSRGLPFRIGDRVVEGLSDVL